jgi:hypothetical protein
MFVHSLISTVKRGRKLLASQNIQEKTSAVGRIAKETRPSISFEGAEVRRMKLRHRNHQHPAKMSCQNRQLERNSGFRYRRVLCVVEDLDNGGSIGYNKRFSETTSRQKADDA